MRAWKRAMPAVLVCALAFLPLGCRDVLGIDNREIATCGDAFADRTCSTCVVGSCCAEAEACESDAGCAPELACLEACARDDALCQGACDPSGATPHFEPLRACLQRECGGACGPACGGVPLLPSNVCDGSCVSGCCDAGKAAGESADYAALRACEAACGANRDCVEKCRNDHAEGASLAQSIDECVDAACGGLGRWACVAPRSTPMTSQKSIRIDLSLVDLLNTQPISDLTIRACSLIDLDCASPLTAATSTDAGGHASLDVPISDIAGSFDGYLEVQGDAYHALLLEGAPVTTDWPLFYSLPSDAVLKAGAASVGVTLDPGRGMVFYQVFDCDSRLADGVSVESTPHDPASLVFYLKGIVPDASLTATGEDGRAGIVNVAPGYVDATAVYPAICGPVASTRTPVRAGWFSGSTLRASHGY